MKFSEYYKNTPAAAISEEKHEIEQIDYNRTDTHDLVQIILKCAAHWAYTDLKKKKDNHDNFSDKNDEDYEEFDFSPTAFVDEIEDFMKQVADQLRDVNDAKIRGLVKSLFSDVKDKK